MPQFRPFPPFQGVGGPESAGEQAQGVHLAGSASGVEASSRPQTTARPGEQVHHQFAPFGPFSWPATGPLSTVSSRLPSHEQPGTSGATAPFTTEPLRRQLTPTTDQYLAIAPGPEPEPAVPPAPLPVSLPQPLSTAALAEGSGTTDQLAELPRQPQTTGNLVDLFATLQATLEQPRRMVVIPAERPRQPAQEPANPRRLSVRQRQSIILTVLVMAILVTMLTLSPLAGGNAVPLLGGIREWIQNQQTAWQIAAHQQPTDANNGGGGGTPLLNFNPPNLPFMTIPNSPYVLIAQQAALDAGISPVYFVRQINTESGFNPYAVSPAGAVGIAQFLPSTAAGLGIDPWNPVEALRGAARLMASYARSYGGDYAKALAAYNAGSGNLQNALNSCGGAWLSCMPAETQNYVYRIMGI
ncbi:lytic transglycosylase domain-containing protein [Thermogemmatispora onikobensis]|uniref:lytic transglycosylase domain-containing protein n=1 Tax=Thermogemmatispora onikobensis TaxID=732234 RepID=UPI000852E24E|nr:lytic transglycosylase domain-containing protein [Thermogemmatispora onikobensis]